jgi:hypothetical protein
MATITVTGTLTAGSNTDTFEALSYTLSGFWGSLLTVLPGLDLKATADPTPTGATATITLLGFTIDTVALALPANIDEIIAAAEAATGVKPVLTFDVKVS